jgi:hypothetical protein
MLKTKSKKITRESSNGRTLVSGTNYWGSNPYSRTKAIISSFGLNKHKLTSTYSTTNRKNLNKKTFFKFLTKIKKV